MAICSDSDYMPFYLVITRQNMANWMIHLADEYLGVMYDYLHMKLYGFHVIQADETPVLVNKDGRAAGSKSFMLVYRSGYMYSDMQIVLYTSGQEMLHIQGSSKGCPERKPFIPGNKTDTGSLSRRG